MYYDIPAYHITSDIFQKLNIFSKNNRDSLVLFSLYFYRVNQYWIQRFWIHPKGDTFLNKHRYYFPTQE